MTIYDSGNAWAVFSKDPQRPHPAWFSLQSSPVWPPIFQTHPATVSQQLEVVGQSECWEQHGGQQEAAGRMEDTPVHTVSGQDIEGWRDLPKVTRLGTRRWCMWALGPDVCHLHHIASNNFKFRVQIINCAVKTPGIKTNWFSVNLVQLHFEKDFRPRIHLLSNFTWLTTFFF